MRLSLIGISFRYPDGTMALRNVSLEIRSGEVLGIVGRNGSGKSTLVAVMCGLLRPQDGEILLDGERANPEELRGICGVLLQFPEYQLIGSTVREDVALWSDESVEKRVDTALRILRISSLAQKSPFRLSGGEVVRTVLAGLLVKDPPLVALDEPEGSLDQVGLEVLKKIIREFMGRGKAVVISTKDVELVAELANRVVVMKDGGILVDGPPREVMTDEALLRSAGLALPKVVEIYRELTGTPEGAPIRLEEFIRWLRSGQSP